MQHQSTSTAQHHARTLRREMTDSEGKLRSGLRAEQQGLAVLRFPTDTPFTRFDGIREAILEQLKVLASHAPTPAFPQRGRE